MCLYCHNFYSSASNAVVCGLCTGLEMLWLQVPISAGRALKEGQCTPEGKALHENVQSEGVVTGVQKFLLITTID